jgi:hypothetical protein
MMGMMTIVRVLPPDRYEEIMARVRAAAPAADAKTSASGAQEHRHE